MAKYRQTKNSGNSYWGNILYWGTTPQTPQSPTVTTDSLEMHFNTTATITGTIVSQGTDDLTEYGFVWAQHDAPTILDNVIIVGTESFTGLYSTTSDPLPPDELVYFAAYAKNSVGVSYGTVLSDVTLLCLAENTIVTTLSGSKFIQDVDYCDDLLVWNFDEAKYEYAKPVWIVKPFKSSQFSVATFDNGSEIKTIADGEGHSIFNLEKGMFTHVMSENTPLGTTTITRDGRKTKLIDKKISEGITSFYNVITYKHMNIFANDILTSTTLNNIYPISDMKFIKTDRNAFVIPNVPDEIYTGLRLDEQPSNVTNKIKRMISKQLFTKCYAN